MGGKKETKKTGKKKDDKLLAERGAMTYEAMEKKKQKSVLGLIVALVVVLAGSVIFMGAVGGWFDDAKVVLDEDSWCEGGCEMVDLTGEAYEGMVSDGKSFVMFVDQSGCTTADKLRGFTVNWAREKGVKVYKMMFSDAKKTSLHDYVKYYPSVVVVSKGKPVVWLRADEDEDSDAYNKEEAFVEWISGWL